MSDILIQWELTVQVADKGEIMRKICLVSLLILLMVSFAYAAPRNSIDSEGKSSFTNIAATGLDVSGVPGYIEMRDGSGNYFYLWIGTDGKFRIASDVAVGSGASPATTSWSDAWGVIVGMQTTP